ncbi:ribosomal protein L24e-domain-containing protein [Sphaerosporella brunnea]|uniref:Ribosome biogenesis protein RLP24 n=1 Tax=Sphaerosporella brunnea TaxID=1250544 RepID=A0A5J5EGA0_9PEZI|nr:ribosomal protein L24e-domain-containing protein [Sphaerosporella brunnea]
MRIYSCHFCSAPVYPSKGITFIRNDAKEFRFCRSKCHKNFKMKRNPRKLKWTKAFRKAAGKEMVVDTTLTFAQRRHVPTRYSRELVAKTLTAMQRVEEIRRRRERVFYKQRMAGNKERQRAADRKLVEENQHLLPPSQRKDHKSPAEEEVEEMDVEMQSEVESEEEEKVAVKVKVLRKKQKVSAASSASMEVDD